MAVPPPLGNEVLANETIITVAADNDRVESGIDSRGLWSLAAQHALR